MTIAGFNATSYLAANPDLIAAGYTAATAEQHYTQAGQREGRSTSFNAAAYIASHADLRAVFGTNTEAATQHYISNGYAEGRQITFDGQRYLASNRDLIAAGITTAEQAALHYISNGYAEGRTSTSFNPITYAAANPDLFSLLSTGTNPIFGNVVTAAGRTAVTQHYIEHGYAEGRSTYPTNWSGTGTLSASLSAHSEVAISLPAGTYQFDMMGRDSGQGTLPDPWMSLDGEILGFRVLFRTDRDSGAGNDARITMSLANSGTYYLNFEQERTAAGGSFTYLVTPLS